MSVGLAANWTGWEEYGGVASLLANSLLLLPTSAVGLAANAFVLLAVWRQKSLQTCNNALLVNLAAGDVLRCIVDCPLLLAVVVAVQHRGQAPPLLCDAQFAAFSFSCCVQLLTLACISAERHQAVAQPFKKAQRKRRLLVLIPATWAVAATVAAVCLLYLKDSPVYVRCRGAQSWDATSSYDTFGLYVLLPLWAACFAVITGFYTRIFALVRAHNRKILDNGTFFTKTDEAADKRREEDLVAGKTEEPRAWSAGVAPADSTNDAKKDSPAAPAAPATPGVPDGSENGAEVGKALRITDLEAEQTRSSEDGAAAPLRLDPTAKTAEEQQPSNARVKRQRAKPQKVLHGSASDPKSSEEGAEIDKAPSEMKGSGPRVPPSALPERTGAAAEPAKSGRSGETPPAASGDGGSSLPPAAATMQRIEVQGPVCMMPTKERKERASKSKESKMAKRAGYIIITFLLFWLPLVSSILVNFIAYKNRNMQTALIQDLEILTVSVACVTSLSDPIIYAAVNPQFRTEFDRLRRKVESVFGEK
ncbi:uncharacterized protein LOC142888756 [Nelusetta ayraudi]|uniref:uncharacterized protein LOC142888756 n=1 Tax=Nelusetta ayraudi TaxID=303726 RepID=UPI003F70BC14